MHLPRPAPAVATLLIAASLLVRAAVPAHATAFCEVVETPAGAVELRAGPAADADLVARMQAGDEVMLLPETSGEWVHVRYWPAGERLEDGGFERYSVGWVDRQFLDLCG